MTDSSSVINWDALQAADAVRAPFPHLIVADMLRADAAPVISRDFPEVPAPGSFPPTVLDCRGAFAQMLEEIQGNRMRDLLADKLGVELSGRKTMVTVRGRCRMSDGKIHRDSKGKIVTVLIYMNDHWESQKGQLRLLNGPSDLNDYFAEAPPSRGAMVAFACADNAWHGHSNFEGERRAVQLNWVANERYLRREHRRHAISAVIKKIRSACSLARVRP